MNRQDRRHLQSISKGDALVTIDLNQPIEARDADNTIIYQDAAAKKVPLLADLVLIAALQMHQSDQQASYKQKLDRGLIGRRIRSAIAGDGLLELATAEKDLLKQRIGLFFMQPDLILVATEALDREVPAREAEAKAEVTP